MGTTSTRTMDTAAADHRAAAVFERAEARAWADVYAAAPSEWAHAVGLGAWEIAGTLVLNWGASARRYFNRTIGLGITQPATEEQLDQILAHWRALGIDMFLLQSLPQCRPNALAGWLRDRGLEPFDTQDRVVRGHQPANLSFVGAARDLLVEPVRTETAEEWSAFLQRVYRFDTGPWLPRLIGRARWHQYIARADGEIVAARGMYLGPDRIAWLGMDGPVPGITTEDYEPDAALCSYIVADGLRNGARGFIADIEAPSADMATPAYQHFAALGFCRPYIRTHYARLS